MTDPARLRKRSVTVAGHPTSLTLEDAFWADLKAAARARGQSVNALLTAIDAARTAAEGGDPPSSLSGAVRVWLLLRRPPPPEQSAPADTPDAPAATGPTAAGSAAGRR
jgi:predicted DNA-binding ribbon-helix-helix protein